MLVAFFDTKLRQHNPESFAMAISREPFPYGDEFEGVQVFVDPATGQVWNLWHAWSTLTGERQNWLQTLTTAIRLNVISVQTRAGCPIEGELVQRYSSQAHGVVEAIAQREVATISKRRWLNYSRRLPRGALSGGPIVSIQPLDESPYHASLIDALTALYGADTDQGTENEPGFEVRADDGQTICRVVECVNVLSDLQDAYRWAGRGAKFTMGPADVVPRRMADPVFDDAYRDYQARTGPKNVNILAYLGTVGAERPTKFDPSTLFGVYRSITPGWQALKDLTYESRSTVGIGIYGRFSMAILSYQFLADLFQSAPEIVDRLEPSISTTLAFLAAAGLLPFNSRAAFASAGMYGFVQSTHDSIGQGIAGAFWRVAEVLDCLRIPRRHLGSPSDLIREASQVPARLWPVRGGAFIRKDNHRSLIDLYGATTALGLMFRQATCGGALANIRATHFENAVQAIVDRTHWKPDTAVGKIRNRTLRLDNKNLTDIDALGTKSGTLLLISCKGRVHDAAIEIGEYAPTRNAQDLAEDAVRRLFELIATLRHQSKGDNFDFSAYPTIIGVVCLPFPLFISDPTLRTRESAPGLRTLLAVDELEIWLRQQ